MGLRARFDEQLSRADQLASVLSLVVAAVAAVGALVLDHPWDARLLAGASVLAVAVLAWFFMRVGGRRRVVTDEVDLGPWRVGVRNIMYQAWVGAQSPLNAVDNLRRDLHLSTATDDSSCQELGGGLSPGSA